MKWNDNSKKMMKSCSAFHIEQKMEFKKFNCFLVDFLKCNFGLIKFSSTVTEREYTGFYIIEVLLNGIS